MQREYGFSIPEGYAFHPGHSWVVKESAESSRVGLDSFAAQVLGKVDRIEVVGLNRWVWQGQKLGTIRSGDVTIDLVSPVEGVVTAVNKDIMDDPTLITRDPYSSAWVAAREIA
jgi:glycine cleavage system H lipoate-binding protein